MIFNIYYVDRFLEILLECSVTEFMYVFVTGVYAFGFLFMLPQLFVNYKVRM